MTAKGSGSHSSSNEDRIKLNGSVTDTLVAIGDVVAKGDILGEYTRQSSTNSLYAPVSGVVTEVPSALGSTLTIAGSNQFKMVIQLPETELKRFLTKAGRRGLGDYRPEKGGAFGTFEVLSFHLIE